MSSTLQEIDIFGGGKKEEIKGMDDDDNYDLDISDISDISDIDLDSYNSD